MGEYGWTLKTCTKAQLQEKRGNSRKKRDLLPPLQTSVIQGATAAYNYLNRDPDVPADQPFVWPAVALTSSILSARNGDRTRISLMTSADFSTDLLKNAPEHQDRHVALQHLLTQQVPSDEGWICGDTAQPRPAVCYRQLLEHTQLSGHTSKFYVAVEKLEENPAPASTGTARSQKLFQKTTTASIRSLLPLAQSPNVLPPADLRAGEQMTQIHSSDKVIPLFSFKDVATVSASKHLFLTHITSGRSFETLD
ncbi:hypothetical protein Anapl_00880 [Anas platyrhynchos]|uniref:Uncharacterized protein n=1 Tax=Anas platyrhynchos TaxID=8839 RepID=R0LAU6_ANAPL|nr:hypothetical protein Anapl_00880 [Anas platyrhynchos]